MDADSRTDIWNADRLWRGRKENLFHKTLVQMADVAVPANKSDVLWRHATFEEAVAYLVATAVVLEMEGTVVSYGETLPGENTNGAYQLYPVTLDALCTVNFKYTDRKSVV